MMGLENWLLLITSLVAVLWPAALVGVYGSLRRCRSLVPERPGSTHSSPLPRVSVVIPARNEQEEIEATVRRLLAQQGVDIDVVVVDDHSTDETALILRRLAASEPRLCALQAPALKRGWLGKTNALACGAELARGDYIVFTDADVIHEPGSVLAAIRECDENGLALLSLMPRFVWETIWEHAAAPAFLLTLSSRLSGQIHDPTSDDALALGAFVIVDAASYRALGGHEAVRDELLDAAMLARHFKSHGRRVAFELAPQCLKVRSYKSAREVFDGAVKNCIAAFGEVCWPRVPVALTCTIGSLSVIAAPFVALCFGDMVLFAVSLVVHLELWLTMLLVRPFMKTDPRKSALLVVGAAPLFAGLLFAIYRMAFHGFIHWRGRAIRT
jgi:hypothetical protein